jgi:predicted nucleic acid-binding Zn ribbon protein
MSSSSSKYWPRRRPLRIIVSECPGLSHDWSRTKSRFCSDQCRDHFDATGRRFEPYRAVDHLIRVPVSAKILEQGPRGAYILCAGCGQKFESLGWSYCSKTCRDKLRRRESIAAAKGPIEAGDTRRTCEAPGCGQRIPRWRKGRAVSAATKYCSSKCGQRARKSIHGTGGPKRVLERRNDKKVPDFIDSKPATLGTGADHAVN